MAADICQNGCTFEIYQIVTNVAIFRDSKHDSKHENDKEKIRMDWCRICESDDERTRRGRVHAERERDGQTEHLSSNS